MKQIIRQDYEHHETQSQSAAVQKEAWNTGPAGCVSHTFSCKAGKEKVQDQVQISWRFMGKKQQQPQQQERNPASLPVKDQNKNKTKQNKQTKKQDTYLCLISSFLHSLEILKYRR